MKIKRPRKLENINYVFDTEQKINDNFLWAHRIDDNVTEEEVATTTNSIKKTVPIFNAF